MQMLALHSLAVLKRAVFLFRHMQLTNSLRKTIASLDDARTRRLTGLFKAEGTKCVADTIDAFTLQHLFATAAWADAHPDIIAGAADALIRVPAKDLMRMSSLSTAPEVIAVYRMPESDPSSPIPSHSLVLALDGVQDPGNLGTIIRTADWYGVTDIICSADCADPFSPKVVMATMGAISRVRVRRCDLAAALSSYQGQVIGTALSGDNLFSAELPDAGVIVMGSEGHGMSSQVSALLTRTLRIPSYPPSRACVESLNVGIATAVVLSEFRRRQM